MKKPMSLHRIRDGAKLYFNKNTPTILSMVAIGGLVLTSVLVAKATVKAVREIDKAPKQYKESKADIVVMTASYYILPTLAALGTITCILGLNILNKKNQALLVSAYGVVNQTYKNYRNKVIELHGKEMDDEIVNEIIRENYECHQIGINTPDQKVIFYEPISERCIEMYERELIDAEYHFNRNYSLRGYAFLNEFYDFLGLDHTNLGDSLGWSWSSGIQWIDFEHRLMEEDDGGTPIYSIEIIFPPEKLEWWEC